MKFFTLSEFGAHIRNGRWKGFINESKAVDASHDRTKIVECLAHIRHLLVDLRHGDKVIIRVSNSVKSACAFISLWESGGIAVPIKREMGADAVSNIAADCNCRFILDPDSSTLVCNEGHGKHSHAKLHRREVAGSDLALIIYTTGSTGKPKGIVLTHANVITAMYSILSYLELDSTDTILCVSPLSFDYGLYQVLFSLAADVKTVLYNDTIQPYRLIKAINDHSITVLPVVPSLASMLERILRVRQVELRSLKKITNTGGHLSNSIIKGLKELLPDVDIYAMYGLTECKRALYLPPSDIKRKPGSVGIPIPGLAAGIFSKRDDPTTVGVSMEDYFEHGPNEIGELFIRGTTIMQEYTNGSSAGAHIIQGKYRDDVWLATGDLFMRDDEGYYYFKGRRKELIKQGAYCLYPADIEEKITQCVQVQQASIIGKMDVNSLEYAAAFVKLKEDTRENRKMVSSWIALNLGTDYAPREIQFVEDFPVDANGKINKKALSEGSFFCAVSR